MASVSEPARRAAADDRILALFEAAGSVDTPTSGMAAWIANDPSNGRRPVLIKRLAAGHGKGRATEALTLHHPNIVRSRRWLSDGGSIYLVRDVIRGRNLRQTIAGLPNGPDLEQLRDFLLPVIAALQFAHERNIAHGGICPENVLVADDGTVYVSDWGACDPRAAHHLNVYNGVASIAGDVKAAGRLIATYLPTRGPFASPIVRGRLEGVVARCETLAALQDTVESLDRLAAAPLGRPATAARAEDLTPIATPPGTPYSGRHAESVNAGPKLIDTPVLSTQIADRTPIILPGGGGIVSLVVRNDGTAPLIVRMVATQHAWLNVRPTELPITIPAGDSARLEFSISAARLSAGEYRSEVYLSANADGPSAEEIGPGWYKHTAEVRVLIGAPTNTAIPGWTNAGESPPFPANAPRLPPMGCTGVLGLLAVALLPTFWLLISLLHAANAAALPVK